MSVSGPRGLAGAHFLPWRIQQKAQGDQMVLGNHGLLRLAGALKGPSLCNGHATGPCRRFQGTSQHKEQTLQIPDPEHPLQICKSVTNQSAHLFQQARSATL